MLLPGPESGGQIMDTLSFTFPNDLNSTWIVIIIWCPFLISLAAGAHLVTSLCYIFRIESLRPIMRFALVLSFALLLVATFPLWIQLKQPEHIYNLLVTPNLNSALTGFVIIHLFFIMLVITQIWFHYRSDSIDRFHNRRGAAKIWYNLVLLGATKKNQRTENIDQKAVQILALISLPLAAALLGHLIFVFGAFQSNLWWSTPLIFFVLFFSAVIAGCAALSFCYLLINVIRRIPLKQNTLNTLSRLLWKFLIIAVVLELFNLLALAYDHTGKLNHLKFLIAGPLKHPYLIFQLIICAAGSCLLLSVTNLLRLPQRLSNLLTFAAGALVLIEVLLVWWNVVIGGQLLTKSLAGSADFLPGFYRKEVLLTALIVCLVPYGVLWCFDKTFPFFPDPREIEPQD